MKSNFEFLNRYWPALAQIGAVAESYVYSDANACLYKLGMFGERLILDGDHEQDNADDRGDEEQSR